MRFGLDRRSSTSASSGTPETTHARTFGDPSSRQPGDRLQGPADRRPAYDESDPYVHYYAVNISKLPNLLHRRAIAAALDRAQLRTIAGGKYAGELGDGVVKPNLRPTTRESGMWTGLLGQEIPDAGDPEYAKQLIEESGEPMGTLRYDYPQTPTTTRRRPGRGSLPKAGINVRPNPIEPGQYDSASSFDPEKAGQLKWSGWGPDWPNASTVIPELFSPAAASTSRRSDDEFTAKVHEAKADTDRDAQADAVEGAHQDAMQQAWAVPTLFARTQHGRVEGPGRHRRGRQRLRLGAVQLLAVRRPVRRSVALDRTTRTTSSTRHYRTIRSVPASRAGADRRTEVTHPDPSGCPSGKVDSGRVHRPSAGCDGLDAHRTEHDHVLAVQRPARRPGEADLREGLHAAGDRGQPAPSRPGQAVCTSSTRPS